MSSSEKQEIGIEKLAEMNLNGLPKSGKREDYLEWEDYFMAIACLTAARSKDPATQVGACLVNKDKKVVGVGYNGFPTGIDDNVFPWTKGSENPLENKYMYVCHAEINAILNKISIELKECILYVALFPCNECAKVIIQSGIKEIVYMSDKQAVKNHTIAAKRMFDHVGIKYRQFLPKKSKIVIDFDALG